MNSISLFRRPICFFYLAAFIVACCTSCGASLTKEEEAMMKQLERTQGAERKIIIPVIKDTTSFMNHLHHKLPYQYTENDITMEILADTTRLCIKGDSCWLEYTTEQNMHVRMDDGSIKTVSTQGIETTDPVLMK